MALEGAVAIFTFHFGYGRFREVIMSNPCFEG